MALDVVTTYGYVFSKTADLSTRKAILSESVKNIMLLPLSKFRESGYSLPDGVTAPANVLLKDSGGNDLPVPSGPLVRYLSSVYDGYSALSDGFQTAFSSAETRYKSSFFKDGVLHDAWMFGRTSDPAKQMNPYENPVEIWVVSRGDTPKDSMVSSTAQAWVQFTFSVGGKDVCRRFFPFYSENGSAFLLVTEEAAWSGSISSRKSLSKDPDSGLVNLGVAQNGTRGITSTGGFPVYAGFIVQLGTDGRIDSSMLPAVYRVTEEWVLDTIADAIETSEEQAALVYLKKTDAANTYATKADATLNNRSGYTDEWKCSPAVSPNGFAYRVYWNEDYGTWMLEVSSSGDDFLNIGRDATSFTHEVEDYSETVTGTRVSNTGYRLGEQDDKPVAKDAELQAHKNDTTVHVTASEKTAWNGKADKADATLTELSGYTDWVCDPSEWNGSGLTIKFSSSAETEVAPYIGNFIVGSDKEPGPDTLSLTWAADEWDGGGELGPLVATRTVKSGYQLGSQADKPLQPAGDYALKSELGTAAAKDVPSSGDASASQVVMGNDSRLSDARPPTAHTHSSIVDGDTTVSAVNGGTATIAKSGFGNAVVDFPEGFSIVYHGGGGNVVYTAPSGGERVTFYGPYIVSNVMYWVPAGTIDPEHFDPVGSGKWCLVNWTGDDDDGPNALIYETGPYYDISQWDSASPSLVLGMGEDSGGSPTMARATVTDTKTVATTDQIPSISGKAEQTALSAAFTAQEYSVGNFATYNGLLYRCKSAYTATAQSPKPNDDTMHWEEAIVAALLSEKMNFRDDAGSLNWDGFGNLILFGGYFQIEGDSGATAYCAGDVWSESGEYQHVWQSSSGTIAHLENLTSEFDDSVSYVIGQLVVYDGALYRCTTTHAAGEWNANDFTETTVEDVLSSLRTGKADRVSGATAGDFAGLDANGNLTDSGKKASDFVLVASNPVRIGSNTSVSGTSSGSVALGNAAKVGSNCANSIAIGNGSEVSKPSGAGDGQIAIGSNAKVNATGSCQIGYATNTLTDNYTLRFRNTIVMKDGKIPSENLDLATSLSSLSTQIAAIKAGTAGGQDVMDVLSAVLTAIGA